MTSISNLPVRTLSVSRRIVKTRPAPKLRTVDFVVRKRLQKQKRNHLLTITL